MNKNKKYINSLKELIALKYPFFLGSLEKQESLFGDDWGNQLELELERHFQGNTEKLEAAIKGYAKFAIDSMKLQVKFQKSGEYENKTYLEAASEVYQNRDYMFNLYLPGILLSHYLWRHHYYQHKFFIERFLPLFLNKNSGMFYDIGVGTGFYSKEMLTRTKLNGMGFDLSPFSLEHTIQMLRNHEVVERYTPNLRDIVLNPILESADCIINIEVLEHLENPQVFLNSLYKMLKIGGHGLISAAINAPNADHIYLYRNYTEVQAQIEAAGFIVVDKTLDLAYEPKHKDELVPTNVAFIVTK